MADNDSSSSASDDEGELTFTIDDKTITETDLIRLLNSTKPKDQQALNTFIRQIIKYKCKEGFEVLFNHGYRIGVVNSKGQTAAHLAFYDECYCIEGRHQMRSPLKSPNDYRYDTNEATNLLIKKWLLKRSDSFDYTDNYGLNYLHIACFLGKIKLVKKCLNSNNVNAIFCHPNNLFNNFTPLHFAVINNTSNAVKIVNCLLEHGADVNATDAKNRTPLHLVCRLFINPMYFDVTSLTKNIVNKLTIFESIPKYSSKNVLIMKILLEHHSNIELKDEDGNTPLLSIFPNNYYEISQYKEYWHFDLEVPIKETMIKFIHLIEAGANILAINNNGDTILHLIVRNLKMWRDSSICGYQLEFNDSYHTKFIDQVIKIKKEFNVNSTNKNDETPLQLAVNYLSCDVVQSLLDYGADVNHLKISWGDKRLFDHINITPNFYMVRNLITIIELFNAKDYDISPIAHLAVLRFLIHNQENCSCRYDLYNLLHFGSSSHVVDILTESYNETGHIDFSSESIDLYLEYIVCGDLYIDRAVKELITILMEEEDDDTDKSLENHLNKELNIMKSTNMQDNTSLFDIMTKHPHSVPHYVVSNFDFDLVDNFTDYNGIISGHLTKTMIRHCVLKYSGKSIQSLCPLLPDLCCEAVLRYLSNADIVNMFAATTTSNVDRMRFFV